MGKFSKILTLAITILFLMTINAFAAHIDFRAFSVPQTNHNAGPSFSTTVDGLTLSFSADGENLWWDSTDGFGVWGRGYEADEIEASEALRIDFSKRVYVSSFDLTDLFYEGSPSYEEIGWWSLDNLNWTSFSQTNHLRLPSPVSNGEYNLDINQALSSIWFAAPGLICDQDHEFSVAGVDVNPVPEPATMFLVGLGLVGIAGFRKKFSKVA